jgi:hypothetical protein
MNDAEKGRSPSKKECAPEPATSNISMMSAYPRLLCNRSREQLGHIEGFSSCWRHHPRMGGKNQTDAATKLRNANGLIEVVSRLLHPI